MYSLIRTRELNKVEPWEYLRDVLIRLAEGWPDDLLPHRWSTTRDEIEAGRDAIADRRPGWSAARCHRSGDGRKMHLVDRLLGGELMVGWMVASALASATAEELVHRALLLRALEGYMNRWAALVVHAVAFELVHVFIYGYGYGGGVWFLPALIYGYAFQRTRSVAVPVLLHTASLVVFYVTVWTFAR